jgi:hypothetical protein
MFKLVLLPILLTLSLFSMMFVVLTGMALIYPDGYPDPFALYTAFAPGKPVTDPLLCRVPPNLPADEVTCEAPLHDNYFRRLYVTSCKGMIEKVTFQADRLQVVDLVERWGHPVSAERNAANYMLRWPQGISASVDGRGRFTYGAAVRFIWLEDEQAEEMC